MIRFAICGRCHKPFDYDLTCGLCPNCGFFNRERGQKVNEEPITIHPVEQHNHNGVPCKKTYSVKTTTQSPAPLKGTESSAAREEKARLSGLGLIRVCVVIVVLATALVGSSDQIFGLFDLRPASSVDTPAVTDEMGTEIYAGDYFYQIFGGYVLADSHTMESEDLTKDELIPEGWEMICIDMAMSYEGPSVTDYDDRVFPLVYDGADYYQSASYTRSLPYAKLYQIDDRLLYESSLYADSSVQEGYMFFLVPEGTRHVTISLEEKTGGKLKQIHNVELDLEDLK